MKMEFLIEKAAKKFWVPRFTTWEMETSITREGVEHNVDIMEYDDFDKYFPSKGIGTVKKSNHEIVKVRWNEYGECFVKDSREKKYDLIRPRDIQNEIDTTRTIFFCIVGIILGFIYLLIKL